MLTTSGGHPNTFGLNQDFRDSGMLHFHAVSNVRHALTAEREGIDAVIATGFEAAGHVGHQPVHTFVLVPSVAAAVDIPVLCAGGVVDGAALAGALALGAEMGYIGSRFLAADECEYHDGNKRFIVDADETQTEVVPCFFGPARFIRNGFTSEVERLVAQGASRLERMAIEGAAMRRGALEGDMETGMMIGGQGIGRIKAVLPAAEIVAEIAAEAEAALERVDRFRSAHSSDSSDSPTPPAHQAGRDWLLPDRIARVDVGVGLWAMRATASLPGSHARLYAELVRDGQLAEELGFHSLWIAEHHFWYDGWCPAPLVAAGAVLGATSRLRVGTGIALVPLCEREEVVEQVAGMQRLADGRLELGVGLGYRDPEFDGFGLARRDRGRRMEAALEALAERRAQGRSMPPVWVGGMAPAAIERAVRHGAGVLLPQTLTIAQVQRALELVRQTAAAVQEPVPRAAVLRHGWVTGGDEHEAARARAAVDATMREYMGSWFLLKGQSGFSLPDALDKQVGRAVDAALIGTSEEIAAGLAELAGAGIDLVVMHLTSDGLAIDHRDNMRMIAEQVLPALAGVSV